MRKKKIGIEGRKVDISKTNRQKPYEIPLNWFWTDLECLFERIKEQVQPDGSEKYIGLEHMKKGGGILEVGSSENLKSKKIVFKKNDILYGKLRPYLNKHAHVNFDGIASTDILVYRIEDLITSKFVNMYLDLPHVLKYAIENSNGINLPRVSPNAIDKLPIPVPPIEEQKRIVEKLEALLSKIEEVEEIMEETKELFELRRASLFEKAFSGELTKKWRANNSNETAKLKFNAIKEERYSIAESNKEMKELDKMFEDFDIDKCSDAKGWVYLKANMFCYNITSGGTPSKEISESGEIPFLKVYNIVNNTVDFEYKPQYIPKEIHESKLKKSRLKPDDVIMNIVGPPLKKIAIIPTSYPEMNMNQAIVRFRPIKYVLPKYLYYCLQYDETLKEVMENTKGVVGQVNISISQSRNLIFPIPSLEEQSEIVNMLEKLIDKEESILSLIPDSKAIENLKQSILSRAYKGKLVTNDPSELNSY
ncbi:restriction endonuclease subunit S [Exiguobacterium sp. s142]|uniref:restriction endonuclease subunit S n=1 Tax=Exiguobacterium sp. s142 TaxID=2751222 RepID=UPI001BE9B9FA|nr:restriction endonuclease subunit S [Exiguobacterium sp. s142]